MKPGIPHVVSGEDTKADYSALSLPATFGRVFRLKATGVKYIDSPEFHDPHAAKQIDIGPEPLKTCARRESFLEPFLRDISSYPLLTAEQHSALFRKYNYLKYLVSVELEKLPAEVGPYELDRLTKIEELWRNSQSVRDVLLLSNLRLVVFVARKMCSETVTLEELCSLGANDALTRAIESFDYTLRYKFSTYAQVALRRIFGRAYQEENKRQTSAVSLEGCLKASPPDTSMTREAVAAQASRLVDELLTKSADTREQEIIRLYYGFGQCDHPHTLEEIAELLGMTKQRVQQIKAEALERLQRTIVLNRKIGELPDIEIPISLLDRRIAAYHTSPAGLDAFKQYVLAALRSGAQTHLTLTRLVKNSCKNVMSLAIAELLHEGEIEMIASVPGKRKTPAQTEYQLAHALTRQHGFPFRPAKEI
jgi:RNA polymerase sigma factor (sigma-70 family)